MVFRVEEIMMVVLRKNWWSLVIRGLAALSLGAVTVARPEMAIGSLTRFFFAYALIDGLVGIAGAVRAAESDQRWASLLAEGATGVVAAVVSVALPLTFMELAYVIAAWSSVTGVLEIASAHRLRRYVPGEWLLASSAAASLILGVLMIALPLSGKLPVAFWLGVYSLVFGTLLIALGFRLQPGRQAARTSI
jgi:uncharacterized membrane protein HdeD (DUF308 family)